MPIPPLQKTDAETKLKSFCESRVPQHARDQVNLSYEIRGISITLYENRVPWKAVTNWSKKAIAQFRYNSKNNDWTLYCADRNEKWFVYTEIDPSRNIADLINEVTEDPTCIFWG